MAVVTREDVYNKMVTDEKPTCPHCGKEMVIWECPPMTFSDGLGWGTPYLYVCFNDDCPLYLEGWENLYKNYAVSASYRCICDPSSRNMDCMPVFSRDGGRGCIVDEQIRAKEEARKLAQRKGIEVLDAYAEAQDIKSILGVLLDDATLPAVAHRAAELMGGLGGLEVIEPVRNHLFKNDFVREKVDAGIALIHERNFTKECPFCAEIIKARAVVCKYCRKDLPASR